MNMLRQAIISYFCLVLFASSCLEDVLSEFILSSLRVGIGVGVGAGRGGAGRGGAGRGGAGQGRAGLGRGRGRGRGSACQARVG